MARKILMATTCVALALALCAGCAPKAAKGGTQAPKDSAENITKGKALMDLATKGGAGAPAAPAADAKGDAGKPAPTTESKDAAGAKGDAAKPAKK
jgi:hypothetical protein